MLQQRRQFILDNVSQFICSDNKNIRQAAITVLLNYSIMFLDKADPEGKVQLISAASGGILMKETDA